MKNFDSQQGAILIIVLWFIAIITVMVAALASETRLSAKIVFHNKMALQTWNDTLQALHSAQMELLINRMPDPPGEEKEIPLSERKDKRYRFDGRVLNDLAYPVPKTVTIRIYDHAGRINIGNLHKYYKPMGQLLEKRIGKEDLEKLSALKYALIDWTDPDELKRANGAEKEYYEELATPYKPRNRQLETVEELLLIKGFDEVFKDVEIETVFTVYGRHTRKGVNPNLATREALLLLPGLDEETVDTILVKRREKEFKRHIDFNEFIEPEQFAEVRSWFNFSTSNFYTIAVQVKKAEEIAKLAETDEEETNTEQSEEVEVPPQSGKAENQRAYMVTLELSSSHRKSFNELPKILMVNPYGVLPDTRHFSIPVDESKDNKSEGTRSSLFGN
ncbi:hypothetical protein [Candidatus Parabeggiatoa sp. HSG14]|uniref:general secretion pathway protein GspK n=1 Tax=Candidatus Parabeggiatoa sp. HSG14 TaxID=3055593 RepID=UPI0025A7B9E8|nr:type II secretion system protein GspK [Thiotrichales bacterium HSG14]